jgi:hypothetical protein
MRSSTTKAIVVIGIGISIIHDYNYASIHYTTFAKKVRCYIYPKDHLDLAQLRKGKNDVSGYYSEPKDDYCVVDITNYRTKPFRSDMTNYRSIA